jgi:hypothetical protein
MRSRSGGGERNIHLSPPVGCASIPYMSASVAMYMMAEPALIKYINLMGSDLVTARLYFALSGLWGEIDVALMYHTGVGLSSMNPCASEVPI